MSIAIPLTAGIEIARSFAASQSSPSSPSDQDTAAADPFASDILKISRLAQEKQQNNSLVAASEESAEIPNEAVQVSSTVGLSRSRGNLTAQKAIALYQKVSSLL